MKPTPTAVKYIVTLIGGAALTAATAPAFAHDSHDVQDAPPEMIIADSVMSEPSELAIARKAARDAGLSAPELLGEWSDVQRWPLLAVHAALLPTGKVLAWDATPDDFDEDPHTTDNYTTRVTVWDPVTGEHIAANNDTNADLFCSGSSHLWDGRIVFAGGDSGKQGRNGPLSNSSIYDPWSNTWTQSDRLNAPRWYSSMAPLANGELLTFGGTYSPTPIAEVFQFNKQWRPLPIQTQYTFSGDYSWLQTTSSGDVMYLGPHNELSTLETSGQGIWSTGPERDEIPYRGYGSYAMYDSDKVLVSGGGNSVTSTVIVDMSTQTSTATGPMTIGRRQHNLTVLADGSVLATGGNSSGADLVDLEASVLTPELWHPDSGEWSVLADMAQPRQYHSVGLLLPDGRVLAAGGGYCAICSALRYHEQNAEVFSPPYLFDKDGNAATRPTLTDLPAVATYGQRFTVRTPEAADILKVHLVKLGSVTHSQNQEQRLVSLSFTNNARTLRIQAPANRELAPPGHYLLFLINSSGTPSVGQIIQIGQPLIASDEVVVNTLRSDQWDYYEIKGEGEHILTVSLQGNLEEVDLYVNSDQLPSGPSDNNGFYDCLSSGGQTGRKVCVVSAQENTSWYLGVTGQQTTRYSLLANVDTERPLESLSVEPGTKGAPEAPLNLRGQVTGTNRLELFWDKAVDDGEVLGYEIWRNGRLQTFTIGLSHQDGQLEPLTQYAYQIVAVDDQQNRSPATRAFIMTTTNDPNADLDTLYHPDIPSKPGSLRFDKYSPTAIELFWQPSIDNGFIAGYEIYRNDTLLQYGPGVSYFDGSITAGAAYTYQVVAVDNEQHRSAPSNTVSINLPETPDEVETNVETVDVVDVDGQDGGLLTGALTDSGDPQTDPDNGSVSAGGTGDEQLPTQAAEDDPTTVNDSAGGGATTWWLLFCLFMASLRSACKPARQGEVVIPGA